MLELLKPIPLGLLIRSIFAGGFFVISFCLTENPNPKWSNMDGNLFEVALPVSLFVGVLVYGIQRALLFPFIEFLFETERADKIVKWTIRQRAIDTGIWRWNLNKESPTNNKLLNEQLTKWADHIHTQYSVVLCIIFGSATAWAVNPKGTYRFSQPLFWTGLLFFGAGLFSNARHYAFINGVKASGYFVEKIESENGDGGTETPLQTAGTSADEG